MTHPPTPTKEASSNPLIIMDERERGEIRRAIEEKFEGRIQIETVEVGDFILSPRVGIERKRGDDLTGSIFDHRLFIQLAKLRATFAVPLLILESPKKMFSRSFWNENAIYGALIYVAYKMHIPIIPTMDAEDTAQVIYQLALNEQNHSPMWDTAEVLQKIASQSIKPQFLHEDQLYFLQGLVDVGEKKAKKYHGILGTPYHVIQSIMQTIIEKTKKGTPKAITGMMASFKGTGPKLIARNQRLLTTSYKTSKKNKDLIRL